MALQRTNNTIGCTVCGGSWHYLALHNEETRCPVDECRSNVGARGTAQIAFASFYTLDDARKHHFAQGGWLFVPEKGNCLWFNQSFTASAIFNHSATRGLDGKLI